MGRSADDESREGNQVRGWRIRGKKLLGGQGGPLKELALKLRPQGRDRACAKMFQEEGNTEPLGKEGPSTVWKKWQEAAVMTE